MNPCFFSKPRGLLAVLAISPALWLASAASAQSAQPTGQSADTFRSALEGYQPYTDEKIVNWKEANDVVGRIGGWRAYAKEAREPDAAAGNAASTATVQGGRDAKPEPTKNGAGSHMGHGGKP